VSIAGEHTSKKFGSIPTEVVTLSGKSNRFGQFQLAFDALVGDVYEIASRLALSYCPSLMAVSDERQYLGLTALTFACWLRY